jgi:murein DD-endopeptidase MepM/ murein hydrolase activator NlpD
MYPSKWIISKVFFLMVVFSGCALTRPSIRSCDGVYHVVKRGQTLWRICKTYGVDMERVAKVNGIDDPTFIETGQRIFIPGAERVLEVEIYRVRPEGKLDFIWPLKGEISSGFGQRGGYLHKGIDIASNEGEEILASEAGIVSFSGDLRGYGRVIIIKHNEEFSTIYAHNQINLVREGNEVRKGDVIARVGRRGKAKGPHLHFEIRRWGRSVDPLLYLP